MVWQSAPLAHQLIPLRTADQAVQQPVSMNVAGLFSAETEIDSAKPVDACLHAGPPPHFGLDFTNGANAGWMKQTGHPQ